MFKVVFLPLETPCFPERVPELRFYLTQYAPNLTHTSPFRLDVGESLTSAD